MTPSPSSPSGSSHPVDPSSDPSRAPGAECDAREPGGARDRLPVVALLALACATFMSVTIEMLPTGLMHLMAPDLGVSEPEIGFLMTIFAACVVVTSTPLTHLLRRAPRHVLLVAVLLAFCLGSLGTALAPTYPLVVASRIVAGIAHGVFWAVVASYTALITPKPLLAKGISIALGGGSTAFVLGVPLGTALGQALGWRMTFLVIVALCLVVAGVIWLLLPRVDHRDLPADTSALAVVAAPTSPDPAVAESGGRGARDADGRGRRLAVAPKSMSAVALVSALTGVAMFAQYAFSAYISPYALDVIGIPEALLSVALFAYGGLSAAATLLMGVVLGDRPRLGILGSLGLMIAAGAVLWLLAPGTPWIGFVGLAAWGLAMGFLPPLLQSRILVVAPTAQRDVASAIYSSSFNVGIGGGAFVGGLIIAGLGIGAIPPFFIAVLLVALVLALLASGLLERGRAREARSG